jgi:hypothetical protein
VVPTTHSARLHAAVDVTPEGKWVVSSSQWSAQPDGVGDLVALLLRGRRVGLLGDGLAGGVDRELPVQGTVVGLHHRLELAEELADVGRAAGEELLERRAPERVLVVGRRLLGHATTVRRGR